MEFKLGDKVTVGGKAENYEDYREGAAIRNWLRNKTVLYITCVGNTGRVRVSETKDDDDGDYNIYAKDLRHASKGRKYPENAITRVQALTLAKKLHPDVTHIVRSSEGEVWYVCDDICNMTDTHYTSAGNAYHITIPIRYSGTWQDSAYPRVYFSKPLEFKGFEHAVTVKEDGSLSVGCNEIPSAVVDAIIKHRTAELKKFPKNKSSNKKNRQS